MQNTGQGTRNALIIGASGGIGRAVALALAKQGINLCLHGGKNSQSLKKTCDDAEKFNIKVSSWQHVFSTVGKFIESIPGNVQPDIVVVALGPLVSGALAETSMEQWQFAVDTNLVLPGAIVSRFGPGMAERNYGRIVLFGGTGTDQIKGYKEIAAYSAAKTGLGVLAKSAAREWGPQNVSCNIICPGYIQADNMKAELESEAKRRMPNGILQTTENMANLVLSVISDSENGMNGAILSCGHGL